MSLNYVLMSPGIPLNMHDGVEFAIFISFVLGVVFPYRYEHVPPSDSKRDSPTAGNTMSKATGLRSSEFSISSAWVGMNVDLEA